MVDIDPLDPNAIRAATEAVRLGKEIIGSVTGGRAEQEDPKSEAPNEPGHADSRNQPDRPDTVADFNNQTIFASGNVTVNNYVTNIPTGTRPDAICCHDYLDGLCPHRRNRD